METTKGKQHALKKLQERRKTNAGRKKVNNASLYAGSPMYYYCKSCNGEIVLFEGHTCAVPALCGECKALKDLGWLEK